MQLKTTVRYHYIPTRVVILKKTGIKSVSEEVKKLKLSLTVDENVKCSSLWKIIGQFFK